MLDDIYGRIDGRLHFSLNLIERFIPIERQLLCKNAEVCFRAIS
jgi:hypothetical protein